MLCRYRKKYFQVTYDAVLLMLWFCYIFFTVIVVMCSFFVCDGVEQKRGSVLFICCCFYLFHGWFFIFSFALGFIQTIRIFFKSILSFLFIFDITEKHLNLSFTKEDKWELLYLSHMFSSQNILFKNSLVHHAIKG